MKTDSKLPTQTGFTLIELLATLAIVGILILISYPNYTQYVLKTHRIQAEVSLLDLAGELEHYHAQYQTYAGATFTHLEMDGYSQSPFYDLSIAYAEQDDYLVQAKPLDAQAQDTCGTLSLNALGQKSALHANCW